ncbi:MAG: hypothetical protein WBP10_06245 [Thermoanaerobaculia bacterium]
MLSIERFRELVDPDGRLDEPDLRELRRQMHNLAEVLVEIASDRLSKSQVIEIAASTREEAEVN